MSVMKKSNNTEKNAELKKRRAELIKRTQSSNIQRWLHVMRQEVEQEKRLLEDQEIFSDNSQKNLTTHKSDGDKKLEQDTQVSRFSALQKGRLTFQSPSNREIIECRTKLLEEKIREDAKHAELIRGCAEDDSFLKRNYLEANERKYQYRADLQNQILYNSQRHEKMKEDDKAENKVLENIRQSAVSEEIRKKNKKKELANSLHSEGMIFLEAKQISLDKEKEFIREKDIAEARIMSGKQECQLGHEKRNHEVEKAREILLEKFARKVFDDECQAFEREADNHELRTRENKWPF